GACVALAGACAGACTCLVGACAGVGGAANAATGKIKMAARLIQSSVLITHLISGSIGRGNRVACTTFTRYFVPYFRPLESQSKAPNDYKTARLANSLPRQGPYRRCRF